MVGVKCGYCTRDKSHALLLLPRLLRRGSSTCFAKKLGPDTTTGIRPLLLDLQGMPRDESPNQNGYQSADRDAMLGRLSVLMDQLKLMGRLCKTRGAFVTDKKGDIDVPAAMTKACHEFDTELFAARCEDWYTMVQRQHELSGQL